MERLFSYGTLQLEPVQLATFGRKLTGDADTLMGYVLSEVAIKDPVVVKTSGKTHHPILKYTGKPEDRVTGTVFELTPQELAQADEYEVDDYIRVLGQFQSGRAAFVYVCRLAEQTR